MCGEISTLGLLCGHSRIVREYGFEPIADEFHLLPRLGLPSDDLPETFAAIGSAFDKTNTQMTYLFSTKTIDKHFAVNCHSKPFSF